MTDTCISIKIQTERHEESRGIKFFKYNEIANKNNSFITLNRTE